MHPEALEWVERFASTADLTALEIGGRDINGTGRTLFPGATWTVLDIEPGAGVSVVADAATWEPDQSYDLVLCTEVFEHTPAWRDIIATAHRALAEGGRFVATAAGPGRLPHSGWDGAAVRDGEWYENIDPADLRTCMAEAGFTDVVIDEQIHSCDVRAVGVR